MKKRMLALLMTLCLVVSLLPAQLVTAEGIEEAAAETAVLETEIAETVAAEIAEPEEETVAEITDAVTEPEAQSTYTWTLTADKYTVAVGDSVYLEALGNDGEPVDGDFCEWQLSDNSLATINGNGYWATLVAKAEGTVTATLETALGAKSVEITVTAAQGGNTVMALGDNNLIGSDPVVQATFTPSWESGEYVFFVEGDNSDWYMTFDNGVAVTRHRTAGAWGWRMDLTAGTTYNVVINNDSGEELRLRMMMISPDAPDLSFPQDTLDFAYVGDEWSFPVLSLPPDGLIGSNIQWQISDPNVVAITPDRDFVTLNFIAVGSATLTATDLDSGKSVSQTFTVYDGSGNGGNGDGNHDQAPAIEVEGNGGQFTVNSGEPQPHYGFGVAAGSTLAAEGVTVSNPVFWDSSRAFAGWQVTVQEFFTDESGGSWWENVPVEGVSLLTTAEMLQYPARTDGKTLIFIAQWAGDDEDYYSNVAFDGFGGEYEVYMGQTHWSTTGWENWRVREGETIASGCGRNFDGDMSIQNVVRADNDFNGWLQYVPDGNGGWLLTSLDPISTDDVMAMTVTGDDMLFVAYWNNVSGDEYMNYGQGNGGGNGGGDYGPNTIEIDGDDGEFTVACGADRFNADYYGEVTAAGESLADAGISISDPVFWDSGRAFLGWQVCVHEEVTDEYGDTWWDRVPVEGEPLLSTAEMLQYPSRTDGKLTIFVAQWDGNDDDYYSGVAFEGFGGEYEVYMGQDHYGTISWENWYSREGGTIASEVGRHFGGDMSIQSVTRPDGNFLGWIQYTNVGNSDNWMWQMVSPDPLTSADIMSMTVTDEDMLFVAYWDNVSWDEYENYGQGGGEGGDSFPVIPEDVTPTAMELNKKYALNVGEESFYRYTVTEDGWYAVKSDAPERFVDAMIGMPNLMESAGLSKDYSLPVNLQQGDVLDIKVFDFGESANIWLEKIVPITKLEVVEQDTSVEYPRNPTAIMPFHTLKDVTLKATFADGSTVVAEGSELVEMGAIGGMPLWPDLRYGGNSDTAEVIVYCCGAETSFRIKLTKEAIVKIEASFTPPFGFYENTFGTWIEEGDSKYFIYNAEDLALFLADYTLTWSDGTTETFNLDRNGQAQYRGINLDVQNRQWQGYYWSKGVNTLEIAFGELTTSIDVEIKETPLKDLEMILPDREYVLGDPEWFTYTGEGWIMNSANLEGFQLKATFKDGTVKTLTENDITDYMQMCELLGGEYVDGILEEKVHTGAGKNRITMNYMGLSAYVDLEIVTEKSVDDNSTFVDESVVEKAAEEKTDDGTVKLEATAPKDEAATGAKVESVKLPVASVEKLAQDEEVKQVEVKLDSATVTLDTKTLAAIAEQAEGSSVTLSVEQVDTASLTKKQQQKLEKKNVAMVISAEILCNGEAIGDFNGGEVVIAVDFAVPAGKDGKNFVVCYISDDGEMEFKNTTYRDGKLYFVTDHFSDYVVVENEEAGSGTGTGSKPGSGDQKPGQTKPGKPAPDTGDSANLFGLFTVLMISGLMAVALLALRKRSRV